MKYWLACTAILLLASGCGTMNVDEFTDGAPRLILEDYFTGRTKAAGIFEDRFGVIQRQFVVDIQGTWDGRNLELTENFVYDDGEAEERVWVVTKTGSATYTGETANAIGTAIGETAGNAFHWQYDFALAVGDNTWNVHFDDWMLLQPDGVLLNKATVSRWGFKLGTVFLSFRRVEES